MQPVVMAPKTLSNPKTAPKENQTKDPRKKIGKYRGVQWQAVPNPGEYAMG